MVFIRAMRTYHERKSMGKLRRAVGADDDIFCSWPTNNENLASALMAQRFGRIGSPR